MTPDAKTGYGQYNAGNYSNPEVDRLTLETQTMTDPKARAEVLRKDRAHSLRRRGARSAELAASLLGRSQESSISNRCLTLSTSLSRRSGDRIESQRLQWPGALGGTFRLPTRI